MIRPRARGALLDRRAQRIRQRQLRQRVPVDEHVDGFDIDDHALVTGSRDRQSTTTISCCFQLVTIS